MSRNKSGKQFIKLDKDDSLFSMITTDQKNNGIAILSIQQRLIVFGQGEIKKLSNGGRGVSLIALDPKDEVVDVKVLGAKGLILLGTNKKMVYKEKKLSNDDLLKFISKRGRKGKVLNSKFVVNRLKVLNKNT